MPKNITTNDLFIELVKLNSKIEEQNEKFVTKEEFSQKHDLVITTLDRVLGEVIAMRQEQSINSQRFDDTGQEIEGLKKRVKKLEDYKPTQQL